MDSTKVLQDLIVALFLCVCIGALVLLINLNIEAGKFHHETRVGALLDYLSPYQDCYVIEEIDNEDSSRRGGVIVTLACQK